jgi:drug/metabolite transporter (DMT)-like permease
MKEKPNLRSVRQVVLPSILSTINIILFIYVVKLIPANIGQLLYVTTPIIVSILSYAILKERLTFSKISGVVLGLMGTLFLLATDTIKDFSFDGNYSGFLMILTGAVMFSFYLIYTKKLQNKFSPVYITTVFNLTTMLVALILSIGELRSFPTWSRDLTLSSIGVLLYVSVLGTSAFYLLGQYAVKLASPLVSSVTQYVQVPFTVIWAFFLIGEKVTPNFILAAAMIIVGAWLVSK